MMDLSEELIRACADAINGKQIIEYQGENLDFEKPFKRATMHDLVKEALGRASFENTLESCSFMAKIVCPDELLYLCLQFWVH